MSDWVLIVTGEEAIIRQLDETAQGFGWRVEIARSCLEGMQKYIRRRFSVVFVDMALPVQGGAVLAQFVRNCGDDTVLIGLGERERSTVPCYDAVLSEPICQRLLAARQ